MTENPVMTRCLHPFALGALLLGAACAAGGQEKELPVEYLTHVRFGRQHLSIRNTFRAASEFQMAVRVYADDADAWIGLAQAMRLSGDDDAALLATHRALELAPDRPALHLMLGDIHAHAGRRLAATCSYLEVEKLAAAGGRVDAADAQHAADYVKAAAASDPGFADKARAAAKERGAPARTILRYFAQAPSDGSMRGGGSEAAGQPLVAGCLRWIALDDNGLAVPGQPTWNQDPGIVIDPRSTPPTLRAGPNACNTKLALKVAAGGKEVETSIGLSIIGPPQRIAVRPFRTGVKAGERVHFMVAVTDEAGHHLYVGEVHWSLEFSGDRPPGKLIREVSQMPPEHFFEPLRNILNVDAENPPAVGSRFKVIAAVPDGSARGACECVVEAGPAPERVPAGTIPWLLSYEDAVAAAREKQMPMMVEFTAEW